MAGLSSCQTSTMSRLMPIYHLAQEELTASWEADTCRNVFTTLSVNRGPTIKLLTSIGISWLVFIALPINLTWVTFSLLKHRVQ